MHSSSSSSSEDAEDESSPASSVSVGCSRPRSLAQSAWLLCAKCWLIVKLNPVL